MGDRWVNAVIEIRIPLDVPVDASREEKLGAVAVAMNRVQMPDTAVAACRWEIVEDGEPISVTTRRAGSASTPDHRRRPHHRGHR